MCGNKCPFPFPNALKPSMQWYQLDQTVLGAGQSAHDAWCLDVSVPSQLLIVLIDTIHGVLVGVLDLGDDPALGLPVADSQLLVSKPCTPP